MPLRGFHRSQSEALPPTEKAYRRAARELRDFHRARSLDVILEEDHRDHDDDVRPVAPGGGMLKKKRAVLCLADLVGSDDDDDDFAQDGSSAHEEDEGGDVTQQQTFVVAVAASEKGHCWGHFTVDTDNSDGSDANHHHHHHSSTGGHLPAHDRIQRMVFPAMKHRTMRRFGPS